MPAPLYGWQEGVTYAGAAGISYTLDQGSMQPTAGTYYPQAQVDVADTRQVVGRYRTASDFRTDLGLGTTDTPTLAGLNSSGNVTVGDFANWTNPVTAISPDGIEFSKASTSYGFKVDTDGSLQLWTNSETFSYHPDGIFSSPTIKTDTISVKTAGAGVTIDGVLLKDNKISSSYISGLATVATSGSAADITTGTLSNARLSSSVVVAGRTTFSKSAVTIASTSRYVAQIGTYTPGTDSLGYTVATLPDASTVPAGQSLVICDESASLRPWFAIRITPNGTQKIDGVNAALDMIWPGQTVRLVCNGTDGWRTETSWPTPNNALLPQQGGRRDFTVYENDCYYGWSTGGSMGIVSDALFLRNSGASTGVAGSRHGDYSRGVFSLYMGEALNTSYNALAVGGPDDSSGSFMRGQLGTQWAEFRIRTPDINATDYSGIQVGIGNGWSSNYTADLKDGVYWQLTTSSVANWRRKTAAWNGTVANRTDEDSGIAYANLATDEWLHLAVEWDAAGGKGHFFYGKVSASNVITWTYAGTITTNVPGNTRISQPLLRRGWLAGAAAGGGNVLVDRVRACVIPGTTYARIP